MARKTIADLEVRIENLEDELRAEKCECDGLNSELTDLRYDNHEALNKIVELEKNIKLAGYRIEDLTTGYDSRGDERDKLKLENTRLIKKLEALEASLDTIAMAATAGLAVTEL